MTAPVLTLIRLQPDRVRLARWLRGTGQGRLGRDSGYALHAAMRAVFGDLAPRPFSLREREAGDELLGYVSTRAAALDETLGRLPREAIEPAKALGTDGLIMRELPTDWRGGERYGFEVRVVPVVRSRSIVSGRVVEIDAARHAPLIDAGRDLPGGAHAAWTAAEIARGGAAELLSCHPVVLSQYRALRRSRGEGAERRSASTWLPDLTLRGTLRLVDGEAFGRLLARGLGRHRAFGFGCLLLAPDGALDAGS